MTETLHVNEYFNLYIAPTESTAETTRQPIVTLPTEPEDSPENDLCRADDQIRCFDGKAIICSDQVCDGVKDCPGAEDEDSRMNCSMAGLYFYSEF